MTPFAPIDFFFNDVPASHALKDNGRVFALINVIFLFIIITLLFLVSIFVDNLLMGVGAHKGGASWLTILVGLIAGIAGTILLPPFGGLVAAPLAIFLLEYLRLRDFRKAWKAFSGMVVGYGASYVVRFVLGLLIMALWWLWVWKG